MAGGSWWRSVEVTVVLIGLYYTGICYGGFGGHVGGHTVHLDIEANKFKEVYVGREKA